MSSRDKSLKKRIQRNFMITQLHKRHHHAFWLYHDPAISSTWCERRQCTPLDVQRYVKRISNISKHSCHVDWIVQIVSDQVFPTLWFLNNIRTILNALFLLIFTQLYSQTRDGEAALSDVTHFPNHVISERSSHLRKTCVQKCLKICEFIEESSQ